MDGLIFFKSKKIVWQCKMIQTESPFLCNVVGVVVAINENETGWLLLLDQSPGI
jgi:hypothetical protein